MGHSPIMGMVADVLGSREPDPVLEEVGCLY